MTMLSNSVDIVELLKSGGALWALFGAAVMLIPKLLEVFRDWRKDTNEEKSYKRQNLLDRLTTMEDIITNQQARYIELHSQLISEREVSQLEKMDLQNEIFDLKRRVKILEDKIKKDEELLSALQGDSDVGSKD